MSNTSKEFDILVQSLLKNKLKNYGYEFRSDEEFDAFVKNNIYQVFPEKTNAQQFYLGKPNKNGILLFTYKLSEK